MARRSKLRGEEDGRHHGSDDFAGMSNTGLVIIVTVAALAHPWQALKELFPAIRRRGLQALKLTPVPFMLPAAMLRLRLRRKDRGPTFEDYLHAPNTERLSPHRHK